MATHSQAYLNDLLAVLSYPPSDGITPAHACKLVGYGSVVTARHGLRALVEAGKATFTGEDGKRKYNAVRQAPPPGEEPLQMKQVA